MKSSHPLNTSKAHSKSSNSTIHLLLQCRRRTPLQANRWSCPASVASLSVSELPHHHSHRRNLDSLRAVKLMSKMVLKYRSLPSSSHSSGEPAPSVLPSRKRSRRSLRIKWLRILVTTISHLTLEVRAQARCLKNRSMSHSGNL